MNVSAKLALLTASGLFWGVSPSVEADTCAMHRATALGYGGQAALQRVGRGTVRPFVGLVNPRYASTQSIGGPVVPIGAHHALRHRTRASGFQQQQARDSRQVQVASDSELMDGSVSADDVPTPLDAPDGRSPDYPGQEQAQILPLGLREMSRRAGAASGTPRAPAATFGARLAAPLAASRQPLAPGHAAGAIRQADVWSPQSALPNRRPSTSRRSPGVHRPRIPGTAWAAPVYQAGGTGYAFLAR